MARNDKRAAAEIGVPVDTLRSHLAELNSNRITDEVTNE